MELRQLRHFLALAEEIHFGRAADRLCISQPALSASIQKLEDDFQVRLFERDNKSVRITLPGELMLGHARELLNHVDRTLGLSRALAQGKAGRMDVGFSGVVLNCGLYRAMMQFRASQPKIEIRLREFTSSKQVELLRAGRLDAGLVSFPLPPAGIEHLELFEDRFVACVPESHSLAKCPSIDIAQLRSERFILQLRESAPSIYDQLVGLCVTAGFYPEVVFESNHILSTVNLVSRGAGVALVLESIAEAGMPAVVFIPLHMPLPRRCGYLVWDAKREVPGLKALVEELTAFARSR